MSLTPLSLNWHSCVDFLIFKRLSFFEEIMRPIQIWVNYTVNIFCGTRIKKSWGCRKQYFLLCISGSSSQIRVLISQWIQIVCYNFRVWNSGPGRFRMKKKQRSRIPFKYVNHLMGNFNILHSDDVTFSSENRYVLRLAAFIYNMKSCKTNFLALLNPNLRYLSRISLSHPSW